MRFTIYVQPTKYQKNRCYTFSAVTRNSSNIEHCSWPHCKSRCNLTACGHYRSKIKTKLYQFHCKNSLSLCSELYRDSEKLLKGYGKVELVIFCETTFYKQHDMTI